MRDVDKARAEAEARRTAGTSGYRPGVWAALNRYLSAEAVVEHHHSEQDRDRDAAEERKLAEQRTADEVDK